MLRLPQLGKLTGERAVWVAALIALLVIGVTHEMVTDHQLARTPSFDEGQYLHEAWLLGRGERIYRDFMDNHSPLLYASLRLLEPTPTRADAPFDVRAYFTSARIAMAVCGALAAACAGLVAFRVTRRVSAPVVVMAVLTGSYWTWHAGMAEIRAEPAGLCLFWGGALLLLWDDASSRGAALRTGAGLGLVALSALWNPKWPLESIALGAIFLRRLARLARRSPPLAALAIAPAVLLVTAGASVVLSLASAGDYVLFVSVFNRFLAGWFKTSTVMLTEFHGQPFYYCSRPFRGIWPLLGCGVVGLALVSRRARAAWLGLDARGVVTLLLLVILGATEIVALYAFPNLWPQYYLMWSFSLSAVYGCVPGACVAIARGHFGRGVDTAAIVTALVLYGSAVRARLRPLPLDFYWTSVSFLVERLAPEDTVWVEPHHHPIAARDADYYWHGFSDTVLAAFAYADEHPGGGVRPGHDGDLPICRFERGGEPYLRFVSGGDDIGALPAERACLNRLRDAGRVSPTPMPYVYELDSARRRAHTKQIR